MEGTQGTSQSPAFDPPILPVMLRPRLIVLPRPVNLSVGGGLGGWTHVLSEKEAALVCVTLNCIMVYYTDGNNEQKEICLMNWNESLHDDFFKIQDFDDGSGGVALVVVQLRLPEEGGIQNVFVMIIDKTKEGAVKDGLEGYKKSVDNRTGFNERFRGGHEGNVDINLLGAVVASSVARLGGTSTPPPAGTDGSG